MKKLCSFFIAVFLHAAVFNIEAKATTSLKPEAVVQKQFDAYNTHDIESFLEVYAENIELYRFPSSLQTKGKGEMRERYTNRFKSNAPHAIIVSRMVMGNTVVDHERLLVKLSGVPKTFEVIAIYEITDSKIFKVTFIEMP